MSPSGGDVALSDWGDALFPAGALPSQLWIGWHSVEPRFTPGLRRYHPIGQTIELVARSEDGRETALALGQSATLRVGLDRQGVPTALLAKPAARKLTRTGWEGIPSSYDPGSKLLTLQVTDLPATIAVVDGSQPVAPATFDPTDPAAAQLSDGFWGLAAVDQSGNLIYMRSVTAQPPIYWSEPATVEYGADSPALVRAGSTLALFYAKVAGSLKQVFLTTSTNGGSTWSTPMQLTNETAGGVYQIQASTALGTTYVFWSRSDVSGLLQYRSSVDLSNWSAPTSVGHAVGPLTDFTYPSFDVKRLGSGTWALSWLEISNLEQDPNYKNYNYPVVWVATSPDLAIWSNEQELCIPFEGIFGPRWPTNPSLGQTGSGTLYTSFGEYLWAWDWYHLFYRTSGDDGVTWTSRTEYETGTANNSYLSVDNSGGVRSFWDKGGLLYFKDMPSGEMTQVVLAPPAPTEEPAPTSQMQLLPAHEVRSTDPVITIVGAYAYSHTDLAIPGLGPSPVFSRGYNSGDTRAGVLGPGWTHSYAIRLTLPSEGSQDLQLVQADGQTSLYTYIDGAYQAPPGATSVLVKNEDGTYTVTSKDQSVWMFDAHGKLSSIKDRYGNESTLSYDPATGRLVAVSDPAGRGSLSLGYDAQGRLHTVADWASPQRAVTYDYDAQGRLWMVTDREGETTTYGYDGTSSRLTTITDANGHTVVTMTYDAQGRVSTQKDARGLTTGQQTTFDYVVNGDGSKVTTVTYPATSADPAWYPLVIDYFDASGLPSKRVSKPTSSSSEDVVVEYGYDSEANLIWTRDGRSNQADLCYDADYTGAAIPGSNGNLTRRIDPAPTPGANRPVTLFQYDAKNNLTQTVSPKGVPSGTTVTCATNLSAIDTLYATDLAYDATQTQLLSTTRRYTDPDTGQQTAVTRFEYGDANNPGLVTKVIPPRGNTGPSPDYTYATTMAYFGPGAKAGLLQSTTDPLGNVTTYDYDSVGRRTSMVDPNGNAAGGVPADHTWQYVYDDEDRLLFTKAPPPVVGQAQLVTEFRYDAVGNRTVVIDANGQVTKYVYDERDSLAEVHQSPNAWADPSATPSPEYVTAYQYDNSGNLSRVVRASGDGANERATDYGYDGLQRVRKETQYPSWPATSPTLVTQYGYDAAGNRTTLVDPLSQTTTFGYDNLNRLTSVTYSDGVTPNAAYTYDAHGNRLTMSDGTGNTSYSYDELDRLLSVTSPGPKTVGYRYDLDGNRTRVIYPDSSAVAYTFDKSSRLESLLDWASRSVGYQYFPDGSLKQVTNFNGTSAAYSYDNALRLTQVRNQGDGATVSEHTYALDAVGNRTQADESMRMVQNGPSQLWGWGLNASGQVGDGTTTDRHAPVAVSGLTDTSAVSAGDQMTVALKSDGTVWEWGSGALLGRGPSQANSSVPLQVMGPNGSGYLTGITAVAAGHDFTLALKSDGTVWAWGYNNLGQVGDNTNTQRYYPVQVYRLTGATAIAAGYGHSLALLGDGTVMAWGYNNHGQLGNHSTRDANAPVQVRNLTGVSSIAAGWRHSMARKTDGTVWTWGYNYHGELGDGTTTDRNTPVQVLGPGGVGTLNGITAISAASEGGVVLKNDGTVWAWGYNLDGSVGDGTTQYRSTPVQVVGAGGVGTTLTGISAVGGTHAVDGNGTLWSWGYNGYGNLGIGTSDNNAHPVPVQTSGISGTTGLWSSVGATNVMAFARQSQEALSIDYGYDKLYRLTSRSGGTNASYANDPVGNRSSMGSTSYSYDRADRITAAGSTSYTVNANGNLVARGSDSFGYDQANRLKTASVGGISSSYVYDGDGKRASKTVGGNGTSYAYDVNASLPVLLDDGTRKYVWGLGLAFAVDNGGNPIAYHADGLGSVRALTDGSGSVVQTYQYDDYGAVTSSQGSIIQPFQYTGEQVDTETGLSYLRARYYDSGTGRFLGRDLYTGSMSSPQSLNLYGYAENNPVNATDPSGNNPLVAACGGGALFNVAVDVALSMYQGEKISGSQLLRSAGEGCVAGLTGFGLLKVGGKLLSTGIKATGSIKVYQSVNALTGDVQYVGITNDLARRTAEHAARFRIVEVNGLPGLSPGDARAVEQALIEFHGLGSKGGTLSNKINTVAPKNPDYAELLRRGAELLHQAKYPGF